VEDPADGGDPLGEADVEEIRVRLPAMEQDGLPDGPRQPELGDERGPLDGPGREVAVVVEPDLADRDDPRRAREQGDPLEARLIRRAGIVRMDADGGVDVGLRRGEGDRRHRGALVRPRS
jgi:hypothetical protein